MASSISSSLSSTHTSCSSASSEPVPVPPTTPTGDLSTPLDLDHLDSNILTGAATVSLPAGFPTIVPPNTIAGSVTDVSDGANDPLTPDLAAEYVPEVNNWSEDVQARFANSLRGMAQLAVDVHKLDTSKTVAEHYCSLVAAILREGPIPFTPPQEMFTFVASSDDMKYYISDIEESTRDGWDVGFSLTQVDSNTTLDGQETSTVW